MEDFDGRIIMLILFVVISGVKWFIENVKNRGQDPHETSESLEEIYDDFREEIRNRQTKAQHPQDIFTPHHHEFGQQSPPPLPTEPQYIPEPTPEPRKIRKPQLSLQEKAALASLMSRSTSKRTKLKNRNAPSLRDLLDSPHSARQAIVLHEVLGKPRSMQG